MNTDRIIVRILEILLVAETFLFFISLIGLFSYYPPERIMIGRILPLVIVITISIFLGYMLEEKVGGNGSYTRIFIAILVFFTYRLLVDIWIVVSSPNGINTSIGIVIKHNTPIFDYIVLYDVLWCVTGICFSIIGQRSHRPLPNIRSV